MSSPKAEAAVVVVLTPPGQGAVATLLLAGAAAETYLDRCFQPRTGQLEWHNRPPRVRLGRWIDPTGNDDTWEDVVIASPAAEQFEIHCHGGPAVVNRIVGTLTALGATARNWHDWSEANESLLAREALEALAAARSQRTAAILLDQYRGALHAEIEQISKLVRIDDWPEVVARLTALQEQAPLGLHLSQPWRVVISGPPNAGKSSLVNALAGYQRAIVSPLPGTTRDVLTTPLVLDGWPLELSDTAGLRTAHDVLESAGIERARQQLSRADLAIELLDGGTAQSPTSPAGSQELSSHLTVVSKADLPAAAHVAPQNALRVSALTGQGMEELVAAISQRLVPAPPVAGTPIPFTSRQFDLLASSLAAADSSDAAAALAALSGLLS